MVEIDSVWADRLGDRVGLTFENVQSRTVLRFLIDAADSVTVSGDLSEAIKGNADDGAVQIIDWDDDGKPSRFWADLDSNIQIELDVRLATNLYEALQAQIVQPVQH